MKNSYLVSNHDPCYIQNCSKQVPVYVLFLCTERCWLLYLNFSKEYVIFFLILVKRDNVFESRHEITSLVQYANNKGTDPDQPLLFAAKIV